MPIDYTKSKIYKLTTPHNVELVYYGSTVNPLYKRKGQHKAQYKINKNKCTSKLLFEIGIDDVIITLVENVNCNTKEELLQRERFYIKNNNCVNKNIPTRTNKEYKVYQKDYKEINKDKIKKYKKEYNKEYREINKDKQKEYQKEYKEINKDKIKEYQKEYNKEYYEANKDNIKEYQKKYYGKKDL